MSASPGFAVRRSCPRVGRTIRSCLGATLACLALVAAPLVALACGGSWTVASTPNVSAPEGTLKGVAVISANNVWAVGGTGGIAGRSLIEHWDGSAWSVVASPNNGSGDNEFEAVAAVSPTDIWAVGQYQGTDTHQTLAAHYDGTSWSIVATPNTGPTKLNALDAVSAVASNDVWAAGVGANAGNQGLIEHWDGTSWTISPSSAIPTGLNGITAISHTDVWAVGTQKPSATDQTAAEHWDGTSWTLAATQNTGATKQNMFDAVTAIATNNVYAVGFGLSGTVNQTLIEHYDGTSWTIVASANAGASKPNQLNGVSALSGTDIWAVGQWKTGGYWQTLAEHWDGTSWTVAATPDTNALEDNILYAAAATASNNVWAVGYANAGNGADQTLTDQWTSSWATVVSPNVTVRQSGQLEGTAASSATDVWAVGETTENSGDSTLIEHSNGTAWTVVASPNGAATGYSDLRAVAARTASDAWAVGYYSNGQNGVGHQLSLIEHWDGTAWTTATSASVAGQDNYLYGVTALGPSDVWAVGLTCTANCATISSLTEHWDGTAWSIIASPNPTGATYLYGVSGAASNDVWAVGSTGSGAAGQTFAIHWDGSVWTRVASPNPGTADGFHAVTTIATNDVWAVGFYGSTAQTLMVHWDGTSWTAAAVMPNQGSQDNTLLSVSADASNDVWAVGRYATGAGNKLQPLTEHWDGTSWTIVAATIVGTGDNSTNAVVAISTSDIWFVGAATDGDLTDTVAENFACAGTLSLAASGSIVFPAVALSGPDQSVTQNLTLTVTDTVGSGWHIQGSGTQFTSGGNTLPVTAVTVPVAPAWSCITTCTLPTNSISYSPAYVLAGTPTTLCNAAAGTGTGGAGLTGIVTFDLAVPANTLAATYTSSWTFSIASGP